MIPLVTRWTGENHFVALRVAFYGIVLLFAARSLTSFLVVPLFLTSVKISPCPLETHFGGLLNSSMKRTCHAERSEAKWSICRDSLLHFVSLRMTNHTFVQQRRLSYHSPSDVSFCSVVVHRPSINTAELDCRMAGFASFSITYATRIGKEEQMLLDVNSS